MPAGRRWTAWCEVSLTRRDQQLSGGCFQRFEWNLFCISATWNKKKEIIWLLFCGRVKDMRGWSLMTDNKNWMRNGTGRYVYSKFTLSIYNYISFLVQPMSW
jgi:hypothetical protein